MNSPCEVRLLDPTTVDLSPWGGRLETDAESLEFEKLKDSVSKLGGNVQPIKVVLSRDLDAMNIDSKSGSAEIAANSALRRDPKYTLVFGLRRLRACRMLGLPVRVLVAAEGSSGIELFVEAVHENSSGPRALSPYELGRMFCAAMDQQLFPSVRRLATCVGVEVTVVQRAMLLGRLPMAVVDAFRDPRDLRLPWAQALLDAYHFEHGQVVERAERLKARHRIVTAHQTYLAITGKVGPPS